MTDSQAKKLALAQALKMTPTHRRYLHGDPCDLYDIMDRAYLLIRDIMSRTPPVEFVFPRGPFADEERRIAASWPYWMHDGR